MAYFPFAPQVGAIYTLKSPTGIVAVFNDTTDPNYVGVLNDVTGLDSAEVREVADDLVQQDGGQHGHFWLGRRPITMNGIIFGHSTIAARAAKVDKLLRASMALRGDATLTWKPVTRKENLVPNPGFEASTSSLDPWQIFNNAGVTASMTRVVSGQQSGVAGLRHNGTLPTTGAAGESKVHQGWRVPAGSATQIPITGGKTYTLSAYITNFSATAPIRMYLYFYTATEPTPGNAITAQGIPITGNGRISLTVTAHVQAVSCSVMFGTRVEPPNGETWDYIVDDVLLHEGSTVQPYFDGSMSGYYWQGTPGLSGSADYIEMYTPVRRQQPVRTTGAWNKEFQVALVSEWASLFSSNLTSISGNPATCENRGSYPTPPTFRLTGPTSGTMTNPQIAVTGAGTGTLKTTLSIGTGAWVDIDTFTHTAVSNTGASVSRYIDFAGTTTWPVLNTGNNTVTMTSGGNLGTLTTTYRDAWA